MNTQDSWTQTILGEPASKANSRRLILVGKHPRSIKSEKALNYEKYALAQIRPPAEPFDCEVCMVAHIHYCTQRPDLDESLIMDILEKGGVVKNDRRIREKHIFHYIDKENPRARITITPRGQNTCAV